MHGEESAARYALECEEFVTFLPENNVRIESDA